MRPFPTVHQLFYPLIPFSGCIFTAPLPNDGHLLIHIPLSAAMSQYNLEIIYDNCSLKIVSFVNATIFISFILFCRMFYSKMAVAYIYI
jgi:hypothetical protein